MNNILRELRAEDSDFLYSWINDQDLVSFNAVYKPVCRTSHDKWFKTIMMGSSKSCFFAIDPSTEQLPIIGTCSIRNIDYIVRQAELQIRIGVASSRGKGYGYMAMTSLIEYGFFNLNLNRLYLEVFATNERAISLYEKCGLVVEGRRVDGAYINGQYVDVMMMALLRRDFRGRP